MDFPVNGLPVVQKYGGTSVGNPDRIKQIASRVAGLVENGLEKVAIVVSAMSGETDRLVGLMRAINPDAADRNYDMAVAAGEQVSVALMAAALDSYGLKAKGFLAFQLGIMTSSTHSRARIESIDCSKLFDSWARGEVPVIAGFQGTTPGLDITTLGRGGSDTSAVALAVSLGAAYCEINTDVDGVFSSDPRIVKDAVLQPKLDFEVALEMASLGSKVLHSRCVELGAKYKLPIIVRNTFGPENQSGTLIMSMSTKERLEAPVVSGVTVDKNVVKLNLQGLKPGSTTIAQVFELIATAGINVDIIVHDESLVQDALNIGFTIEKNQLSHVKREFAKWKTIPGFEKMQLAWEDNLAKVSVVGLGMQSNPGVASKTFSILTQSGIEILMISTSEIKISCVVNSESADAAASALHQAFITAQK